MTTSITKVQVHNLHFFIAQANTCPMVPVVTSWRSVRCNLLDGKNERQSRRTYLSQAIIFLSSSSLYNFWHTQYNLVSSSSMISGSMSAASSSSFVSSPAPGLSSADPGRVGGWDDLSCVGLDLEALDCLGARGFGFGLALGLALEAGALAEPFVFGAGRGWNWQIVSVQIGNSPDAVKRASGTASESGPCCFPDGFLDSFPCPSYHFHSQTLNACFVHQVCPGLRAARALPPPRPCLHQ